MRILNIRLLNYIGIYNGCDGLREIFIDFSKSLNKITIIRGLNGSGKTTLWSAMHMYPDDNKSFMPGDRAEKQIQYITADNIIYDILFMHGVKSNGDRETTKVYCKKITNGLVTELNPNGNVNSYKSIIEDELDIDPNFLTLSRLSSEDKGLVDRTPSERKRYIASLNSDMEAYNNINKKMSKLYSVYKKMIDNILNKIGYLGDRNKIELDLESIKSRLSILESKKNECNEALGKFKSTINLLDPDQSIQNSYNEIYTSLYNLKEEISTIDIKIQSIGNKINLGDNDITKLFTVISKKISELDIHIQIKENEISNLLNSREQESNNLLDKESKVNQFDSKVYEDLCLSIKEKTKTINEFKKVIDSLGINPDNISVDEYIIGINTLTSIKEMIDTFKADNDIEIMEIAIANVKSISNTNSNQILNTLNSLKNEKISLRTKIETYRSIQSEDILKDRPSECNIDSCPFIKDSLESSKVNIDELEAELNIIQDNIIKLNRDLERTTDIESKMVQLNSIIRTINNYLPILNKLPVDNSFKTKDMILDNIIYHDFKEIDLLKDNLQYANYIENYKIELNNLMELEKALVPYKQKIAIMEELMEDIKNINSKLDNLNNLIQETKDDINSNKTKLSTLKTMILDIEMIIDLQSIKNDRTSKLNELVTKFDTIKTNMIKIKECLDNITITNDTINKINEEINPLIEEQNKLKHSLILIDDYNKELETYSNKFKYIDICKKYSNPVSGIQTIFMSVYMNKTLEVANNLLSMLFYGEYQLQPYVLNDSEFRIPCLGSGIMNDDISSMSYSQRCLISMIISFALLYQSSSIYNILRLDEIDGGLDQIQRRLFIQVLEHLISIMNIDQVIIISHNTEFNMGACDVIELKMDKTMENLGGNIIFKV